jgi:hypothetical protein
MQAGRKRRTSFTSAGGNDLAVGHYDKPRESDQWEIAAQIGSWAAASREVRIEAILKTAAQGRHVAG